MSQCNTNNLISKITEVVFEELRLIGGVATGPSTTNTDTTDPFQHSVELPPDVPHIETVRITLSKTTECGTDANGVIYWGDFEVQRNEIIARAWTGHGSLSQSQISAIQNSISLNHTPQADVFDINVTNIANAGAQYFNIVLPYREQSVQTPGGTITADFFSIDVSGTDFTQFITTVTPPNASFPNGQISIDGGDIGQTTALMSLTNIAGQRPVLETVEVTASLLNISVEEYLSSTQIFSVRDSYFDTGPSYYQTLVTTGITDTTFTCSLSRRISPSQGNTAAQVFYWATQPEYTTYSLGITSGTSISVNIVFAGMSNTPLLDIHCNTSSGRTVTLKVYDTSNANPRVEITVNPSILTKTFPFTASTALWEIQQAINADNQLLAQGVWSTFGGGYENFTYTLCSSLTNNAGETSSTGNPHVFIRGNLPAKNVSVTQPFNYSYSIEYVFSTIFTAMLGTHAVISLDDRFKKLSCLHLNTQTIDLTSVGSSVITNNMNWIGYGDPVNPVFSFATYPTLGALATAVSSWGSGVTLRFVGSSVFNYYDSLPCTVLLNGSNSYPVSVSGPMTYYVYGDGSNTTNNSYTLSSYSTINALVSQINADYPSLITAASVGSGGSSSATSLSIRASTNFTQSPVTLVGYNSNLFQISTTLNQSVSSLVSWINTSCAGHGVTATAITNPARSCLTLDAYSEDITLLVPPSDTLTGQIPRDPPSSLPQHNVEFFFNVRFASGGNPNEEAGLQVAYGGFNSNGTLTAYNAPNTFYEPVYNILFPIEFVSQNAQIAYVIVRSRQNLEGTEFSSSGSYGGFPNYELNYIGSAQFSNGAPNEVLQAFVPTDPAQVAAWTDLTAFTPGGVPAVFAIPMRSSLVEVTLEDRGVTPPLTVQFSIINAPSAFDQYGFLGVNRTNQANSQTESRDATAYGLVLDNRGAWDVLIAPEAHLQKVTNGDFSHMNASYDRTIYDDDEGYDFTFNDITAIPSSIRNAISLSPVPNYPQVWVLRIEPAVKQYLAGLRESAPAGSNVGCQLTVDMLVTGRTTGVRGIARVVIYYDYTCVYDVGLCDYFWNLQDPPQPNGPEIIQNQLEILYQPLVDCDALNNGGSNGGNVELDIVWLTRIHHLPTFPNGNALLLMKSHLTSEIDGFFMPSVADLEGLRFEAPDPQTGECPLLSSDTEIMRFLNREVLVVRQGNGETYVTDPVEIQSRIQTESAYLWMKPVYNFPPVDFIKDCGANELVVVGMGFQFKNWLNGQRNYAVVTGAHLLLPTGVYAPPEIDVCFRYYYNQRES